MSSAALDLLVFVSLTGLGHAVRYRRGFREREQRAATLEAGLTRARLHLLQAQLQPHFLFNTLNSITALVRQNPAAAEEMLTSLSDLLRLALSQSGREWTTVREELHFLDLYLNLQRMRFGDRLRCEQRVDPAALDCRLPGLLLQSLVENAIRHGLEPTGRPGTIRLSGHRDDTTLELSVEDDGVGCPELETGQNNTGVGIANVRERLTAMYGEKATLMFSKGSSGGLRACIRLPARTSHQSDPNITVS
jgi:LytS/YehU family sensor histidine kinase